MLIYCNLKPNLQLLFNNKYMKKFKLLLIGMLLSSSGLIAQQAIKGMVKDKSTGDLLPGVSVVLKGTTNGTSTDFDGNFELKNVKAGDVLTFSYLGYANKDFTIASNFNIVISLEQSSEQLDEIVVIGYGTTTIKDATGSVEAITAKDFTKGNIVTPENLLSGRVSGVNVTTSGAPGSGSQITIRGGSSIGASNSPLIVIDGLPIEENGVAGSRGVLSSINPNDIESFSVLKDASATAIYGSRASNGVIIIVTKKGRSEFSLNLDMQYTAGEVLDRVNVFSADEFRDLINSQPITGTNLDASLLGNANTNWQNEILRSTVSSLYNITAKGALFGAIPARLSLGFAGIEGSVLTSQFDRSTASLSLNPSLFDSHLKINLNYNLAYQDNRFGDAGQIGAALRYDPTQPVYDPDSPFAGYYQHRNGNVVANGTQNPVASLMLAYNTGNSIRNYGNLNIDYKFHFLPDLKFVANIGMDKTVGDSKFTSQFQIGNQNQAQQFTGTESSGTQERLNQLFDSYLSYSKELKNFKIDLTTGYSYQRFENFGSNTGNIRDTNSFATTFADPDVVNIGFFGRANLAFFNKYRLTLNYRRDGTSRFSEANRWGDFGGAAFAWQLSEEDFLKDSETISDLKIRASYGITGQQNIPGVNDIYLDRYRFGNQNSRFLFGNAEVQSTVPSIVNPNLKWEETTTVEFGIDYGLFSNRFTGSANVFRKTSSDLLFNAALADGTNFGNSVIQNIGELQIDGAEFTINADLIKNQDFNWNTTFNATYLDRKITKLANGQDVRTGGTAGGTGNTIQLFREGFAPNSFHVYKQLFDNAGNPIEGAYTDLNGDGTINDDDRYLKENPNADITLGFQSSFNYKNVDLAFNLRASIGNYNYNNVNSSNAQYELLQDNAVLGNIPSSVLQTNFIRTSDVINSDLYLENASFLKMDNITLGYTIGKASGSSIRLWAGVQNVFVITNYSGLDPEIFNGIDNLIYPRSRNFLLGANIKF